MTRASRYVGQFRPEFSRLHRDKDLAWLLPFQVPYLVGVVGERYAGKSSVLTYLSEQYGFRVFTLGARLREIARERGVSVRRRRDLRAFAEEMRDERGDPGFLARDVLHKIRRYQLAEGGGLPLMERLAIGGIKHVAELEVLQSIRTFELLHVRAADEVRLGRAREEVTRHYAAQNGGKPFGDLSPAEQLEFFKISVDAPESAAASDRYPGETHALLGDVIAAEQEPRIIDTSDDSLVSLEIQIDEILREQHQSGVRIEP